MNYTLTKQMHCGVRSVGNKVSYQLWSWKSRNAGPGETGYGSLSDLNFYNQYLMITVVEKVMILEIILYLTLVIG